MTSDHSNAASCTIASNRGIENLQVLNISFREATCFLQHCNNKIYMEGFVYFRNYVNYVYSALKLDTVSINIRAGHAVSKGIHSTLKLSAP